MAAPRRLAPVEVTADPREKRLAIAFVTVFAVVGITAVLVVSGDASTGAAAAAGSPTPEPSPHVDYASMMREAMSAANARSSLIELTNSPHVAGTYGDYVTAVYVQQEFINAGIADVKVEEYEVLLSLPQGDPGTETGAMVQLLDSGVSTPACNFSAVLREAPVAADPTSSTSHAYAFHGYAPSGDVVAGAVYVNYCRTEDFEALKAAGVDVSGVVVVCRYGRVFRGNKVSNAASRGAVGVIIYSDPADDGSSRGDVFPAGPWRPLTGVQRGSVFVGEGDPVTPGMPSTNRSLRLTLEEASQANSSTAGWALPSIPSLPMSAEDAMPLLASLVGGGPLASSLGPDWQGGLPLTYHVGPGACSVRLKTVNQFATRTIWNVIATIPGSVEPDRVVVLGNHRDAWVAGAVDPSGGTTALLEVARGFGKAYREGWKPRRSIVLASWDAEEYGLVGSVEWVEHHLHTLSSRAVAYLNVDEAVESMGSTSVRASPLLRSYLEEAAKVVEQPTCPPGASGQICDGVASQQPGDTLYDLWLRVDGGPLPILPGEQTAPYAPSIGGLGSGSDFAAFMEHAGIPSADISIASVTGGVYGVYHSVYDSFYWVEHFGDPTFAFHVAAARYWATIAMSMADDTLLAFSPVSYARALTSLTASLDDAMRAAGGSRGAPTTPGAATLDMERLEEAVASFAGAAIAIEAERAALVDAGTEASFLGIRGLNDRLMLLERAFVLPEGLPGRGWFKHVVYSPSEFNAYGSSSFPGVSDAIVAGEWRLAQRQLDVVCHLIGRAVEAMAPPPH